MGLYNSFGTDRTKEREGRWFEIASAANEDGTVPGFKMARMHTNNPAYQAAVERVYKDHGIAIENDTLDAAKARPLLLDVFAETVLIDWRNVELADGSRPAHSKEGVIQLLNDLPDLYETLAGYAKKLGNFRSDEVDAIAKKSQPPSSERSAEALT